MADERASVVSAGRVVRSALAIAAWSGGAAGLVLVSTMVAAAPAWGQAARPASETVLSSVVTVFAHFNASHQDGPGHYWLRARVVGGSGFHVGNDLVVTSAELVRDAIGAHVRAVVGDPNLYHVESVLALDPDRGLALLKVASPARRPLPLARGEVRPGDPVHAVGSSLLVEGTVTSGVVRGESAGRGGPVLGVSAPRWPGSGGGPVVNAAGEVVGVMVGPPGAEDRTGFVTPVAALDRLFASQMGRRRLVLVPKGLTVSAFPRAEPGWAETTPKPAPRATEPASEAEAPATAQDAVLVRAATVWAEPEKVAACQLPSGARVALGSRSDVVPWMWNVEVREGPQRGCKGVIGPADFQLATAPAPATAPERPRTGLRAIEQPLPPEGEVRAFTTAQRLAPFGFDATPGTHGVVKLVEAFTRTTVMTVFVRGGTSVRIRVPFAGYEIRFATGATWYGYEHLFGRETTYYQFDRMFDFRDGETTWHGHIISLYPVPGGQLRAFRISREQY